MFDFDSYIRLLREDPKTIVLPEGTDTRVIEAASRLLAGNFLQPKRMPYGKRHRKQVIISVEQRF